jgi:glutamine---fructose-6-phosphate transaminase (isomerizing)
MTLHSEILEQPDRIADLLGSQKKIIREIAAAIHKRDIRYVFLAARGTSDNAGRYANYLLGAHNHLPLALATPSLFTYYNQPPSLKDALVIGISQSGQSPDIVSVLEEGKRQGCPTLVITNSPDSPLAAAADFVLDIQSGPEKAVAATKTYTAELMGVAMLSTALLDDEGNWKELEKVPGWMQSALGQETIISQAVEHYGSMNRTVVLGRGFNYATAFEWALKLKELTYIIAEPYSPADFQHGPIALMEPGLPVMAVAVKGRVLDPMLDLLRQLRRDFEADMVVISNDKNALSTAQTPIPIPEDVPEWLSPLITILPGQLFTYHLTKARKLDAENPRSIRKVTETK